MRPELQDAAIELRTARLASQAVPDDTLTSQQGSAQAERTEITQIITASGVASLAGTANQITVSSPTGTVTLSLPATVNLATALQIAGTKVIGARVTGFTAWSGAADKTTHATYPTTTASVGYVAAELQGLMDKMKQITEAFKALEDAAIVHGWIGS